MTLGREALELDLPNVILSWVSNRVALLAMPLMNLRRVCFTSEYYNEVRVSGDHLLDGFVTANGNC